MGVEAHAVVPRPADQRLADHQQGWTRVEPPAAVTGGEAASVEEVDVTAHRLNAPIGVVARISPPVRAPMASRPENERAHEHHGCNNAAKVEDRSFHRVEGLDAGGSDPDPVP